MRRATRQQPAEVRAAHYTPPAADRLGYYYPTETPVAVVTFDYMPSVNDAVAAYTAHRATGAKFTEYWQGVGRKAAVAFARSQGLAVEPYEVIKRDKFGRVKERIPAERLTRVLTAEPVEVVVRIWRPDASNYDVHNPYVKPVLDGFTHARLWLDDGCKRVPRVVFNYEGVDRSLAFDEQEREARARVQAEHAARQVRRGKKPHPMRMPVRARFRFEMYQRTGAQAPLFRS